MQQIIDCDVHDLIEIICMRRDEVRLLLADGSSQLGTAATTKAYQGAEYLVVQQQLQRTEVPLLQIELIEVLTPGAAIRHIQPSASGSCAISHTLNQL